METGMPEKKEEAKGGLSPERRDGIWAHMLAFLVMVIATLAPEAVRTFFKEILYILKSGRHVCDAR